MSDFKQFGNPIGKGIAYTIELLTPYERKLGVIPAVLNYQYRNKVMGLNEIEFDIPAYFTIEQRDVAHPFYNIIDNGMLIQVHISGQKEPLQYIVDTVNESTEKSTEAQKHIHAFSKEYFLSRKKFLGMELAGRILYYTPDLPEHYRIDGDGLPRGVLNDIFEKYGITVSHIDESLTRKAREVSIGSTNIYQFLAHLEEVFGCIFKFNGDATKVEIYDSANFGRDTGITISERNIINTFSENTRYEDMVTRLYVYGSDEISIASVNPTGLPYIENLSYFFKENYLPDYLINLYNEFMKLPKHSTELSSLVAQRNDLLGKITEAEFYLEVVRDELRQASHWAEALDLRAKNNVDYIGSDPKYEDGTAWSALQNAAEVRAFIQAVKMNTTITDRSFTDKKTTFVSLLELSRSVDQELQELFESDLDTLQARGGEAGWLAEIDRLKQEYASVTQAMKSLQKNNDFNQYMAEHLSVEQLKESKKALDAVTIEGEYINSDLDSSMLNELLEEGKKELDKLCFPKIQFTVDALDFSQLFDTQDLWNYLLLGDIIYVKTDTGFNYPVHFIGIEHSPDTASLNLQFSSSAALTDSTVFLADLIANSTRTSGILSLNKDSWNKAAQQASVIRQQLKEGFDLAQQQLAGASKQVPILDERGFWLYALDSNENPKPEQIRAINNVIALTKDGWETVEVAITPEGINANAIVVGTLSADRVRLGRFESVDKSTYWDLETNEIKIGDTFFFSPETGLEIDFQPPAKHKNLISTAEFFTEYSVSMPENARHRFETNATTGELRLIAPREAGTYDFYLAIDSAALTQNFTLLRRNLGIIGEAMPYVTFALASSNYDAYSNPITMIDGQRIYTIVPTVGVASLPLSFLKISLTKDSTASETGIVIPPETLALVKEWVPDLTWQDTVISGVSSSAVINNERIGLTIQNNIENKLAALDITEEGITQRVSSSTKEYFDLNKELFKGDTGPKGTDGGNFTWNMIRGTSDNCNIVNFTNAEYYKQFFYPDVILEVGQSYTFSLLIERLSDDNSPIKVHVGSGATAYQLDIIEAQINGVDTTKRVVINFTIKENHLAKGDKFAFRVRNERVPMELCIKEVKLEKGINSNPTWSPHETEIIDNSFSWNLLKNGHLNYSLEPWSVARYPFIINRVDTETQKIDNTILKYFSNTLNINQRIERRFPSLAKGTYTYSLRVRISNTELKYGTWKTPAYAEYQEKSENILVGEWQTISLVFNAPDPPDQIQYQNAVRFYLPNLEVGASVEFDWEKLELGTNLKPTWSPHIDEINGTNGSNFTWNLIKNSKTNVVSSNNTATVPITVETLTENGNPFVRVKRINTTSQPTRMSLYSNFYFDRIDKMYANKRYTFSFEARASHEATATYWSQYIDRVTGEKTTTISNLSTTIANKNMGLTTAWDTFSITFTMPHDPDEKDTINLAPVVTIPEGEIDNFYLDLRNWKLEEGANIKPIWSPHESDIQGQDGAPGKDGIGITSTTIEYAVNQSGTTHPTTGWSGTVPKTNPGDYIWTKITWNYTDNTSEDAYSVGRIGVDGPDGDDGLPGAPGVGIKMTTITYTKSNSGTVIPPSTATWSSTPPAGNPGEFIWTRTVWTYTDNTTEAGYSVGKIGNTGPQGPQGIQGPQGVQGANGKDGIPGVDGKPGIGISKTVIDYAGSTSGTTAPTTGYTTTVPTVAPGNFLWTRTTWTYTDATTETSYSVGLIGKNGNTGADGNPGKDGVGIDKTLIEYAKNTSGTVKPTTGWSTTIPSTVPGDFLWTRTTWIYTDTTSEQGYTVGKIGNTGPKGADGVDAKLISLSASEQVFKNNTPATITVTGLAQNTSITSWTYSSNSGAFTTTLPAGVTRSGNTVTITQSTMTANTLTIKASDGTYSDTVSIAKLADGISGTDGFTVLLTNESQTFPANSSGTVTSYAGGYSDVVVYYGGTPLTCTTTGTAAPTVNKTYTVTATTASAGTVTLTPSLVSSNYRVTPSALTTDNAIRVLTIVARVNNTNYTFKKTLTYAKSKSGADGADGTSDYLWIRYYSGDLHPWDEEDYSKFTMFPTESTKWIGTTTSRYEDTYAEGNISIEELSWTKFVGTDGKDGATPYIGTNGNWWINGIDTGVEADVAPIRTEFESYRTQTDKAITDRVTKTEYNDFKSSTNSALDGKVAKTVYDSFVSNTATSLASKVSETTYSSDQQTINQKLSTLTQKDNEIIAKFENIGGTNLIKDSMVLTGWQPFDSNQIIETYNEMVSQWDTTSAVSVYATAGAAATGGATRPEKAYKLVGTFDSSMVGKTITFSIYVRNNREYPMYVGLNCLDEKATVPANTTRRVSVTGKIKAGYSTYVIWLHAYRSSYYLDCTVYKALIEVGTKLNEWTQHPDEHSSGSTKINEEGITVGKFGEEVETTIKNDGLRVYDTISETSVLEATRDGVIAETITANDIFVPTTLKKITRNVDLYIGASSTGDGSGSNSSNRADSVTTAFERVLDGAKYLEDGVTINIYVSGSTNETISLKGLIGQGYVNVIGQSGNRINGGINITSNTIHVELQNLNFNFMGTAGDYIVGVHKSLRAIIRNCMFVGESKLESYGIAATGGSNVSVYESSFYDLRTCAKADTLSNISFIDNKGSNVKACGEVSQGGRISISGTKPKHSFNNAVQNYGGFVYETSDVTTVTPTKPTWTPPTWQNSTKTFYARRIGTRNNGSTYVWREGTWIQGTWTGNGVHVIGFAEFGSQIRDWLNANGGYQGTPTVVVKAKRNESSGNSPGVSMKINTPNVLTLPAVTRGQWTSATAGSALANAVATSSALKLQSATSANADYAGFTNISITVTAQKKI